MAVMTSTAPPPIAAFVFRRPVHTRRMLQSLMVNDGFDVRRLTVYCDGPRYPSQHAAVEATRQVVRDLVPGARVVEQETNLGLAESVIRGVSVQCRNHGRVIVVEDDLELSPITLTYLERALDRYRNVDRVMHISAYMFPVRDPLPEAFFYREATCWAWATWGRAWKIFEPDPKVLQDRLIAGNMVHEFDVRGSMNFWEMLELQRQGRIDSWAIRWYATMFSAGGMALHPARSMARNTGFDGSGVHSRATSEFEVSLSHRVPELTDEIAESEEAVRAMIAYRRETARHEQRPSVLARVRHRLGAFLRFET